MPRLENSRPLSILHRDLEILTLVINFITALNETYKVGLAMILLSANANPNAATKDQYTPLHIAAKEGREEVAQLLVDRKANKTLLTRKGFAPIHLAAKYANASIVKLLLDHGTLVDLEGKNMVTPLHVAVSLSHFVGILICGNM
jgi:ankyrin repeat protein